MVRCLRVALPCSACRRHFRVTLNKRQLESHEPFAASVKLHNDVRKRQGKSVMTVEKARKRYERMLRDGFRISIAKVS